MVAPWLNRAVDNLELQIRIALKQTHFEVRCRRGIGKIHSVPFDIKDPVGRTALDRSEDTAAVGPGGATRVAYDGHHILPHTEDGEVIRALIGWRR
jgi:hypothetical protein